MATEQITVEQQVDKGLKSGALGLVSTTIIATASVAPAYSIAATLVFVVLAVGLQSPAVAILAFVPMLLTSIGYSELNKADPDCGTTFTWATRAFNPRTGWAGGWGIIAADVLVMASLAQVAGHERLPCGPRFVRRTEFGSDATGRWAVDVLTASGQLIGRVRFVGALGRDQVARALAAADVVAVPSIVDTAGNVDGLPNTVLEALASGRAVVASHVAGIPEVVEHDVTGLLVPAGNVDALAGALQRLAREPATRERLGRAARERAVARLGWEATARSFEECYAQAAALDAG